LHIHRACIVHGLCVPGSDVDRPARTVGRPRSPAHNAGATDGPEAERRSIWCSGPAATPATNLAAGSVIDQELAALKQRMAKDREQAESR
jgi:hypothetical protein